MNATAKPFPWSAEHGADDLTAWETWLEAELLKPWRASREGSLLEKLTPTEEIELYRVMCGLVEGNQRCEP